jgi:putative redox protein
MPRKPPVDVRLQWIQDLAFSTDLAHHTVITDGDGAKGASPVQLLAVALAGCMGADVALILTRGRQPMRALEVRFSADRADSDPHRFVAVRIHFTVTGDVNASQLARAIELSREKYCSVWHSLRQDIPLELTSSIEA